MGPRLSPGRARCAVLAGALVVLVASPGDAAFALAPTDLTYDGRLVVLATDGLGSEGPGTGVDAVVDIDGTFVSLPDGVDASGQTGDLVRVEVRSSAPLSAQEALAEVAEPAAGDVAQVVSVTSLEPEAGTQAAAGLPSAAGTHALVVLPVYMDAPDAESEASLQGVAQTTASYWATQSAGRIQVAASTRPWHEVARPGGWSCSKTDLGILYAEALAANGISSSQVGYRYHVLVYFPEDTRCRGWAGLGTIDGGQIWVNGTALPDTFSHEFGHNLGLGHANAATCTSGSSRVPLVLPISSCNRSEYGDDADVMGIPMLAATGNLNTALADYLGLAAVTRPSAGSTVSVQLAPLGSVTAQRSVAIPAGDGTVYVDFRPAISPDTRAPAWAGVQVHYRVVDPVYGFPISYLLDMQPTAGGFTTLFGPAGSAVAMRSGASWIIPGTTQVVTVVSVGSTATVEVSTVSALAAAKAQSFVTWVYSDLFHRTPDAGGLAAWTQALLTGTPRVAVANSITGSDEYRTRLIQGVYEHYLGRAAEPAGLSYWLGRMSAGMRISDLEAGFITSDEYYAKAGGTPSGWVERLYRQVLGRTPSTAEVTGWLPHVDPASRTDVAMGFLLSDEHLGSVVDGYYRQLLGRGLDPSGRATWVGQIQHGVRLEAVIGSIVASDEYYSRV